MGLGGSSEAYAERLQGGLTAFGWLLGLIREFRAGFRVQGPIREVRAPNPKP